MPLRIAVVTPFAFPSVRGNAVTVERIAGGLRQAGADLRVWDLSITPEAVIEREVEAFGPRIIHAFHAYRVGPFALRLARRHAVPLVVPGAGTDANHDLSDPQRAATVRGVLAGAATVVVFHDRGRPFEDAAYGCRALGIGEAATVVVFHDSLGARITG